jgi:hypothetical protein
MLVNKMAENESSEFVDSVERSLNPRKRVSRPDKWKRNVKKEKLHSSVGKRPLVSCAHADRDGTKGKCRVNALSPDDREAFFNNLYRYSDKASQDSFLLKCLKTSTPKRRRLRKQNSSKLRCVSVSYWVFILFHLCMLFIVYGVGYD